MSDNEIIDSLQSACGFAEATLMKLVPRNGKEAKWMADAIERCGKAMSDATLKREVRL